MNKPKEKTLSWYKKELKKEKESNLELLNDVNALNEELISSDTLIEKYKGSVKVAEQQLDAIQKEMNNVVPILHKLKNKNLDVLIAKGDVLDNVDKQAELSRHKEELRSQEQILRSKIPITKR